MAPVRFAFLLALLLPLEALGQDVFRSFHVGNSLTWDMQPGGYASRPAPGFDSSESGYHIRGGQSLTYMIDNPEETSEPPTFGTFDQALPGYRWDAVTLQPYYRKSGDEIAAAAQMINLTRSNPDNANTKFYIYSTWPRAGATIGAEPSDDFDFPTKWLNTYSEPLTDDTDMRHRRQWYEWYLGEMRDEVPDADINLIPVGEVLLALDAKFKAGAYPGIDDAADLYRDTRHVNNVGRYTAHMTGWAVMHQRSPELLEWDEGFGSRTPGIHSRDITPTEELSELIRSTVWEVVSTYEPTGLPEALAGDWNGDGIVTVADYTTWRDRGGTPEEYLAWKQNFGGSPTTAAGQAVPEPASWLWAAAGGLAWLARRGRPQPLQSA